MCGRFTLTADLDALAQLFELPQVPADLPARYNIAPTDQVAVVRHDRQGRRRLDLIRWGLIPHWTKHGALPAGLINARAETVDRKPAFRDAWRRRRCLIVASGFYEWKTTSGRKQPYLIRLAGGGPFAFAGIWERWRDPTGAAIDSCAIITTDANDFVRMIHGRMPAVIAPSRFDRWLLRDQPDLQALRELLDPAAAPNFSAYPVSSRVNRPGNDDPSCIEPAGAPLAPEH